MSTYEKMYSEEVTNARRSFKITLVIYIGCLTMIRTANEEQATELLREMEAVEDEKNTLTTARNGIIDACKFRLETLAYEARRKKILGI